ncbi:nuclear pore membrane glycoprotein 210 [Plodia interpunctella]|uniref:nuclear pore membrane glycoprotein 210 n=1 Tax=Plodia interpunctella TaxID=58824 RepID=UPI0023686CDA|nr:nuclear pore membrane glycoprotein 210 [Plodia interpunctella]
MEYILKTISFIFVLSIITNCCESAKINTPRVLLPWFENINVNFTFEIIEGGCYTWSLSRDDIIDLEPLYEDTWGHCSRAARVSVSKSCVPPGSVIILAEEVNTGEILRGDVNIDKISSLKVMSTTWKLYLEEAPEAFEVFAYDELGNKFSTLEGLSFKWSIENVGSTVGEDKLVNLVRWRDTDYEAPQGITEIEAVGLRSYSVLLYGQAMGECLVTVCLDKICTDFRLHVVASVVLTPATAIVTLGDILRYKVVRARAGRLTIQDISETLYYLTVPDISIAKLEDGISLVRANELGVTTVHLLSGSTEVATATLTVAESHSIKVSIRPSKVVISGEPFIIHCILLDEHGHAITAGQEVLIKLTVVGEANIDLLKATQNGTITDAVAQNAGQFTVTATLHSVAGKLLMRKVEGKASATAIDPLEIVPPEIYVAWTDSIQEVQLQHRGGGEEPVVWSEVETTTQGDLTLTDSGKVKVMGLGEMAVRVQLKNYPHVRAVGKVYSTVPELVQVSSTGRARVGRPHHLHVALTAAHPATGQLYNYHVCNCASFAVSLLEGPEPHNVTSATWIEPEEGACCVLECLWRSRGVAALRVARGRVGDSPRVAVRAAPALLWPPENAAAFVGATLPVIAEGESLSPQSADPRIAELTTRRGVPPNRHPEAQLFTLSCRRKGESRLQLTSHVEDEQETVDLEAACAPHVSRLRLEPPDSVGNCSAGPRIWLRPGSEVTLKVTLFDAVGRELLDETGPRVSWETEPYHVGIEYKSHDRLFVETHPDFIPVPVPYKYYQVVMADEQAIGWSGSIRANIPETTASIQARVVAPLKCDPVKVNMAWEGETIGNIARVSGGSGKYAVEAPKGVSGNVDGALVTLSAPGPGAYDLIVTDLCMQGEKQLVEVVIEEVVSVEVRTARALGVGACAELSATARGRSQRALRAERGPRWSVVGAALLRAGALCGAAEGLATLRASIAGVSSSDLEVVVFPPLEIVPGKSRLAVGGTLQLRHRGGPPPHLAKLTYRSAASQYVEVSPSGIVHGLAKGVAKIKLTATDITGAEMASADAELEVVPISGVRVSAATQTLLVGSPGPVWVSAERDGLGPSALAALQPPPRVLWTLRDPTAARLYSTHVDDMLERQTAEGLSVRVVPLKPGVITVDVRVRNMAQLSDTLSWDSTIEILGISDIRTSVDGIGVISTGQRLAVAVGAVVKLKSIPSATYKAFQDGAFEVTADGELKGIKPGHGMVVVSHKDERNNIYRESAIHVEVATPHYCTAEPSENESSVRVALRSAVGRHLLGPQANVSISSPSYSGVTSAYGNELTISGLESSGAFLSFESSIGGVAVRDDVWVTGPDSRADRIFATGSWGICLEGVGWRSDARVSLFAGSDVTLALLTQAAAARLLLRLDRPAASLIVHQLPIHKFEFAQGEWPSAMVPLRIEAVGLTSGPLLCTEDQKYALEGVQLELPFICRTKTPHTANAVLDIIKGELGCSIVPAHAITEASEVELCAEWAAARSCTRVLLLPPIVTSHTAVSLLRVPAAFTVTGHPHALKLVKITSSPGVKIETRTRDGEIEVLVKNEASTCGLGYVNVRSRLTAQDIRVEVERECDVACGTLLGALFSLVRPYLTTLVTVVAVAAGYMYIQSRVQQKGQLRLPAEPQQTSVSAGPGPQSRARTWSRSPYATRGPSSPSSPSSSPSAPVYGDASVLPDQSFSPNSTRMHSTFFGL